MVTRAPVGAMGGAGSASALCWVHAISERAKRLYEGFGFVSSPVDPMTVTITLSGAERILSGERRR